MTTNIYLDVDGVLNAVTVAVPDWGWGECQRVNVNGFPICYSPALVQRFNALAARPDVQVHWLTTWLGMAPAQLAPAIGLSGETWPVLGEPEYGKRWSDWGWWKLPAARDHFTASGERAVWIDDDLGDREAARWATEHVEAGTLLLVRTQTHCGLTLAEFDAIEAWINGGAS